MILRRYVNFYLLKLVIYAAMETIYQYRSQLACVSSAGIFRVVQTKMNCPNAKGHYQPVLKTSDFYRTCNLPKRFEYPSWFYGYGIQRKPPEHPFYRTTSSDYGRYPPTVHSIPTSFFPNNQEFSKALSKTGMYRNYSLNTGLDPSSV